MEDTEFILSLTTRFFAALRMTYGEGLRMTKEQPVMLNEMKHLILTKEYVRRGVLKDFQPLAFRASELKMFLENNL